VLKAPEPARAYQPVVLDDRSRRLRREVHTDRRGLLAVSLRLVGSPVLT
jgi:hypothetical protein